MKKIIFIISVLFMFVNVYSQQQFKIHLFGGYNIPLAALDGNSKYGTNNSPGDYLHMKNGYNIGADIKYFFGKLRKFGLIANISFHGFTTGDIFLNGIGIGTWKLNDVRFGLGAEYDFMPSKKANPFVGIDITGNILSGNFTPDGGGAEVTMNSASRFGLALGAGLDIMVNKSFGFVVGAKLDFINLIGKQDLSAGSNTLMTYYLYDKSGTYDKHNSFGNNFGSQSWDDMNMMDVQFFSGVTFAFGQPGKIVKK